MQIYILYTYHTRYKIKNYKVNMKDIKIIILLIYNILNNSIL